MMVSNNAQVEIAGRRRTGAIFTFSILATRHRTAVPGVIDVQ